jgi:hypothetical protein
MFKVCGETKPMGSLHFVTAKSDVFESESKTISELAKSRTLVEVSCPLSFTVVISAGETE